MQKAKVKIYESHNLFTLLFKTLLMVIGFHPC